MLEKASDNLDFSLNGLSHFASSALNDKTFGGLLSPVLRRHLALKRMLSDKVSVLHSIASRISHVTSMQCVQAARISGDASFTATESALNIEAFLSVSEQLFFFHVSRCESLKVPPI
jgi:hypothetical protein